jgi:hypothetical protein
LEGTPSTPSDAPTLLFHGTDDGLVPYSWAQDTAWAAGENGLQAYLITWEGAGHVPYAEHRSEILQLEDQLLYHVLDSAKRGGLSTRRLPLRRRGARTPSGTTRGAKNHDSTA